MTEVSATRAIELYHGGTQLALFPWRDAEGLPLLLLHGLYERAALLRDTASAWPGPVFGLDLSGHGDSAWRDGGVYSPEIFAADADAALAEIGRESSEPVVVAGVGVGAYAALLLAGGRPELVRAAVLASGRGLHGGGAAPSPEQGSESFNREFLAPARAASASDRSGFDPRVAIVDVDRRPPDYAEQFAARAKHVLLVDDGSERPPWWEQIRTIPTVEARRGSLGSVLAEFVPDSRAN